MKAGTYSCETISGPARAGEGLGYITVEAAVPGVTIGRSTLDFSQQQMRPKVNGLHFKGENITLDFANFTELYKESGAPNHWLDGCRMANSRGGRDAKWRLSA